MRNIFAVTLAIIFSFFFSLVVIWIASYILKVIFASDIANIGVGGLAFIALFYYPLIIPWVIYSVVFSRILIAYRNNSSINMKIWIRDLAISILIQVVIVTYTFLNVLGKN